MKLVLKNTSVKFEYHKLTWEEHIYDVNDRIQKYISSALKWYNDGYCYIIPVGSEKKVKVTANPNKNCGLNFLRTDAHVYNTTPDFCTGYESRISIPLGTTAMFDIPEDCAYVYVYSGPLDPAGQEDAHLPISTQFGKYNP